MCSGTSLLKKKRSLQYGQAKEVGGSSTRLEFRSYQNLEASNFSLDRSILITVTLPVIDKDVRRMLWQILVLNCCHCKV
jgi:hypothetical protein